MASIVDSIALAREEQERVRVMQRASAAAAASGDSATAAQINQDAQQVAQQAARRVQLVAAAGQAGVVNEVAVIQGRALPGWAKAGLAVAALGLAWAAVRRLRGRRKRRR